MLLLALLLTGASTASLAADPARYMSADLIAETLSPAPGSTILVGLRLRPKPGWHGYWSNPGDAGFAPAIKWSAPSGLAFGPILHPAPRLITAGGISSYVHEGDHVLLAQVTIPRGVARGTPIEVTADASWAACTATMCVPLNATFKLDMAAGGGARGSDWTALAAARRKLPRALSGGAYSSDGKSIRLMLPPGLGLNPETTRFFPDGNDAFKTASGRAEAGRHGLTITGIGEGKGSGSISGVVGDGRSAYRVSLAREELEIAAAKKSDIPAEARTAAPRPAPAMPEPGGAETQQPSQRIPAHRFWVGLLLALTLIVGLIAFLRGRRQ